jgi:hypothetical protein
MKKQSNALEETTEQTRPTSGQSSGCKNIKILNNTWWKAEIVKLLIMSFSSSLLILLRSNIPLSEAPCSPVNIIIMKTGI